MLACGDGSNYLAKLTWSRWTATRATGSGIDMIDDCAPDCVSGHFHAYPVAVVLSKPKSCKKHRDKLFGRLKRVFGKAYPGRSRTASGPLFCPLSA